MKKIIVAALILAVAVCGFACKPKARPDPFNQQKIEQNQPQPGEQGQQQEQPAETGTTEQGGGTGEGGAPEGGAPPEGDGGA
jgi:hypothetical protein